MREVVIVGAARTPIGSFQGELAPLKAPELGKVAIAEALKRAGVAAGDVDEVFMGCVLPAGVGQAPARQAAIFAGLPNSGALHDRQQGVRLGAQGGDARRAGDRAAATPMWSSPAAWSRCRTCRTTCRRRATACAWATRQVVDGMIHDGLWDVYNNFHMGTAAELCARERKIDRAAQDAYAIESFKRALAAQKAGAFKAEIVARRGAAAQGRAQARRDRRGAGRGDIEKLPSLKPAFQKDGTVTAGNASTHQRRRGGADRLRRGRGAEARLEAAGAHRG